MSLPYHIISHGRLVHHIILAVSVWSQFDRDCDKDYDTNSKNIQIRILLFIFLIFVIRILIFHIIIFIFLIKNCWIFFLIKNTILLLHIRFQQSILLYSELRTMNKYINPPPWLSSSYLSPNICIFYFLFISILIWIFLIFHFHFCFYFYFYFYFHYFVISVMRNHHNNILIFYTYNYSTRDEKIKSLEAAQTKFKTESIMLDEENNEMRKRLRSLTVSMQAAGMLCYVTFNILYCIVLHCIMSHYIILSCIRSYYIMLHHVIL